MFAQSGQLESCDISPVVIDYEKSFCHLVHHAWCKRKLQENGSMNTCGQESGETRDLTI